MADFDVSIRARLKNDVKREGKELERDLKGINQAIKQLDRAGGSNNLGASVEKAGRAANRSTQAVRNLDREARKLNTVNTNAAEREIDALGKASQRAKRDVESLHRSSRNLNQISASKLDGIQRSTGILNGTMGRLAGSAGSAFGALLAFASVDNIVRGMERLGEQARKLDREVASVAVTAEMRTPEAIARIGKSNEGLSIRYGIDQSQVNDARKAYAAAGFGVDQQEAILDPSLKAAKAGDSTGETIAAAIVAAQQALGVKNAEVPAALDMMAKGSKLGSFEVDAMAKNFPALATMYGGTGRQGLQGWAELIAAAQIVRMGAGDQTTAATNLQNIISKLSSPDTVKNFDEKGVSLEKLKAKSIKNGTPYLMDLVDKVMSLSGGDEFVIGELFGDMQAKAALAPLINNREKYNEFLKQIIGQSQGTVDADYDFLRNRPQEKADRRGAALTATGDKIGSAYNSVTDPLRDAAVRAVNPNYAVQEDDYRRSQLRKLGPLELGRQIGTAKGQLSALPSEMFDAVVPSLALTRGATNRRLKELQDSMSALDGGSSLEARDERAAAGPSGLQRFLFGRAVEPGFNVKDHLGIDLRPQAESSMQGYNEALSAEGDKAIAIARDKAAAIRDSLNFTATPTIAPTFLPPASAPAATSAPKDKQSSLVPTSGGTVKVAQYFPGGNPRLASLRAQREQNRAVRMATARSLSDTGSKTA
ncbi:phage tail tape measure protein [Rhizobium sullae]|uniref:Phage tail tape measure protein n=1 Tax=Rhizobium sullae TaxID=50338 RepID=A0ABY5XGE8_RHISU|nr:phage tail tape measure protein [Rhizobium sullae]UWU13284.1 phage tail tape measure protein [Rhizobium sullae]